MSDTVDRQNNGALSTGRAPGVPWLQRFGFGIGEAGTSLFYQATSLYLLYFYTDVVGLPAGLAGLVYAIGMIWDALVDTGIAVAAERTRTRWGRYRPWVALAAIPLGLSFVALFTRPVAADTATLFIIVTAVHVVFRTCFGLASIPLMSLSARITSDSLERNLLATFRTVLGVTAGLFVSFFGLTTVEALGRGTPAHGFLLTASIAAVAGAAALIFCAASVREPVETAAGGSKESFRRLLTSLRGNYPLWIVAGNILVVSAVTTFVLKSLVYYVKYTTGDVTQARYGLSLVMGLAIVLIPFWSLVTRAIGKRNVWLCGCAAAAAGLVGLYIADPRSILQMGGALAFFSLGYSAFVLTFWSMLPDTVEYGEWRTGVRAESSVFGLVSLAQKGSLGVAAWGLGAMLAASGYEANVAQSAEAMQGLRTAMSVIPAGLLAISALATWFYPLDRDMHARLVREIALRRGT